MLEVAVLLSKGSRGDTISTTALDCVAIPLERYWMFEDLGTTDRSTSVERYSTGGCRLFLCALHIPTQAPLQHDAMQPPIKQHGPNIQISIINNASPTLPSI